VRMIQVREPSFLMYVCVLLKTLRCGSKGAKRTAYMWRAWWLYAQSKNKEIREFPHPKKWENPFWGGAFSGEEGTSEGGSEACRSKPCLEPFERCCEGGLLRWSRVQRPPPPGQQLCCWLHLIWVLGGTVVWGCLACLEPHWPWRLREGCYMLAPNRVGSTLHLHRSGAAASMHHFALMA